MGIHVEKNGGGSSSATKMTALYKDTAVLNTTGGVWVDVGLAALGVPVTASAVLLMCNVAAGGVGLLATMIQFRPTGETWVLGSFDIPTCYCPSGASTYGMGMLVVPTGTGGQVEYYSERTGGGSVVQAFLIGYLA